MGIYSDNISKSRHSGKSPEQISADKCAMKRARNERLKAYNISVAEEKRKNRPTPQVQLQRLDWRFGKGEGAVKERKRLAGRVAKRNLSN